MLKKGPHCVNLSGFLVNVNALFCGNKCKKKMFQCIGILDLIVFYGTHAGSCLDQIKCLDLFIRHSIGHE